MSDVLKTVCDACGYMEGKETYSTKFLHWLSFKGPLVYREDGETVTIFPSHERLDFCSADCLGSYMLSDRVERRKQKQQKEKEMEEPTAEIGLTT